MRSSPRCGTRVSCAGSDRKSTRLNSSHLVSSYAVFCLKKQIGVCTCARERVSGPQIFLGVGPQAPTTFADLNPGEVRGRSRQFDVCDGHGLAGQSCAVLALEPLPITKLFGFFSNDAPPTEIYTLSLHDALPI